MDNLNLNNVFGKPVKYKNIKLYPIKITDMLEFYNNVNCLTINKNKFPDVEIIKMSYLLFLFVISYQEPKIIEMLNKTLNMVLKDQEFKFFFENEQLFLKVNNIIINDFEFDNIKNIILQQNLLNVEQILDPTLEKRLREAEEFLANKITREEMVAIYKDKTFELEALGYKFDRNDEEKNEQISMKYHKCNIYFLENFKLMRD